MIALSHEPIFILGHDLNYFLGHDRDPVVTPKHYLMLALKKRWFFNDKRNKVMCLKKVSVNLNKFKFIFKVAYFQIGQIVANAQQFTSNYRSNIERSWKHNFYIG
jgi:hypothetical protein